MERLKVRSGLGKELKLELPRYEIFQKLLSRVIIKSSTYPNFINVQALDRQLSYHGSVSFSVNSEWFRYYKTVTGSGYALPGPKTVKGIWKIVLSSDEETQLICELNRTFYNGKTIEPWGGNLKLIGKNNFLRETFETVTQKISG